LNARAVSDCSSPPVVVAQKVQNREKGSADLNCASRHSSTESATISVLN
jgi:hypothetical protein